MYILILIVWTILVFGSYLYSLINNVEIIFYLLISLVIIGSFFLITEGNDFEVPVIGFVTKVQLPDASFERGKQRVKEKRKITINSSAISTLLAYMCCPLIICLIINLIIS